MTLSASARWAGAARVLLAAAYCLLAPSSAMAAPAIAVTVAAQVAAVWSVPVSDIVIDFGRAAAQVEAFPASTACRVAGKGTDGYFVCFLPSAQGREEAIRIRAGVRVAVPTLARALAEGAVLTTSDLTLDSRLRWGPPLAGQVTPQPGWVLRRAVAVGDPVRAGDAVPPAVVQQGQSVRLLWARGAIHLEWTGVALHAACAGERVRARVEGRGAPYDGIAGPDGAVLLAGVTP